MKLNSADWHFLATFFWAPLLLYLTQPAYSKLAAHPRSPLSFLLPSLTALVHRSRGGSNFTDADRQHMRRAIALSAASIGRTSPNPCVGCVLVDNSGSILGEGYHIRAGDPHAEVHALKQAGERARGGTAYVSLEPCNHFGRTPPCSLALQRAGVTRVVAAMVDPDPRVSGHGLATLNRHNITTAVGLYEQACRLLNAPFLFRVKHNRPFIVTWLHDSEDASHTPPLQTIHDMLFSLAAECDTLVLTTSQIRSLLRQSALTHGLRSPLSLYSISDWSELAAVIFDPNRIPVHIKVFLVSDTSQDFNGDVHVDSHTIVRILIEQFAKTGRKLFCHHSGSDENTNAVEEVSLDNLFMSSWLAADAKDIKPANLASTTIWENLSRIAQCNAAVVFPNSLEELARLDSVDLNQKTCISLACDFESNGRNAVNNDDDDTCLIWEPICRHRQTAASSLPPHLQSILSETDDAIGIRLVPRSDDTSRVTAAYGYKGL